MLRQAADVQKWQRIEWPMPDVFHRPFADRRASVGARDAESLLNPRVKTVEIRAKRALIDRSHRPVSFAVSLGGRRRQLRADGRSRNDSRPMAARTASERLRTIGLNGPATSCGAATRTPTSASAIRAMVSSPGPAAPGVIKEDNSKRQLGRAQQAHGRLRPQFQAGRTPAPGQVRQDGESAVWAQRPARIQMKAIAAAASAWLRAWRTACCGSRPCSIQSRRRSKLHAVAQPIRGRNSSRSKSRPTGPQRTS